MKKLSIVFVLMVSTLVLSAQNSLKLDIESAKVKINKEIYGHFSEHLGTCIYEGIYVGKDSDIPNINGYRTDVVEAFKEMKVPVLRWPGGCFADTYHWKDGIGPKEDRPSIVNVHWGGVTEDNSFGTHEFLDFCELIGTQPYLSINVGSGTVQEATEWVEYVTSSNESPMTELRKKNGREDPWDVKFWGIGNETWGCGGDMRPEYYADIYRHYASFVRGQGFQKIICGPSSGDTNWTDKIMAGLNGKQNLTQGVSLHHYTLPTGSWRGSKGSSVDFDEEMWFATLRNSLQIETIIEQHWEVMKKYDPRGRIKLVVDEWGTWYDKLPGTKDGFLQQQNTVRDALVAGVNLNIFNNNADRISMANIAQIVNVLQAVILTDGAKMVKTPTYYVFKMFNVHQDATLVPIEMSSNDYTYGEESLKAVNASASIKNETLSITLCNIDPNNDQEIEIDLGADYENIKGEIITSDDFTNYNDFEEEEKVNIADFKVKSPKNGNMKVKLPKHSVVLLTLNK